jgi:hypothetical protein
MSDVNEWLVREFFELHGFFIRAHRKYTARGEEEIELLVTNTQPATPLLPPAFVLTAGNLHQVRHAVVAIKGWHTETFSAARLVSMPEILRFAQPAAFRKASAAFGSDESILKILVLPSLPTTKAAYDETIEFLRNKGVDAILPFQTVLADLVETVEVNRNYQKSELLQLIRILKNYDFLKDRQLELFKAKRRSSGKAKSNSKL